MRQQVYLDTTIPSAYFDIRTPERQALTRSFWERRLPAFEPVISDLLVREVNNTPDAVKRGRILDLVKDFALLEMDESAERLAQVYLQRRVFPGKAHSDAHHLALAVSHNIGYLVSWNFRHLVKIRTRREVNLINAQEGLGPIEILIPPEL